MHYKNYYIISAIIMSLVALFSIPTSLLFPIFDGYSFEITITMLIFIGLEWLFLFIKDKKTIYIKEWYDQFIDHNQHEFNQYKDKALKALNKFMIYKIILLQVYFMLLISTLGALFIVLDTSYTILDIVMNTLYFYFFIIIIFMGYLVFNSIIHKKYYFCYLEPKNENHIYLLMTYYLLQIKHAGKIYINYHDLINTSASLTRILKFKESYEFLTIWRKHLKKMNPLFSFVYIEHCLFDFVMLDMDKEAEVAYKDYHANLKKYHKYSKNKNVEKITYLVDILYAYHKKDYQRVIDLYQRYPLYFKETDYKDSHEYILYQAYLHIDTNKASEIYMRNTHNIYFKQ